MSPFPFFRQVGQVGVLCAVDAAPERAATAPDDATLCGLAVAELSGLIGAGGPPVTVLVGNDERIADPGTLVVLLHATLRAPTPGESALAPTGGVLALSAALHRAGPDAGAPPFFAAAPQAIVLSGTMVPTGDLRDALRRLLAGIVRPLLANR